MPDFLKKDLTNSLGQHTYNRIQDQIQLEGKALPASVVSVNGSIVTVKFEITSNFTLPGDVQMPVASSEYIRLPLQPGDKGVVFPADTYIGNVSGLGGGTANLTKRGNLATLVFFPIGNTAFSTVDPNSLCLNGPNGVVISDEENQVVITLNKSSGINIQLNGKTFITNNGDIEINSGNVTVTGGDVIADGISLKTHIHPVSGDVTGPPEV